jgi:hypothetical protein
MMRENKRLLETFKEKNLEENFNSKNFGILVPENRKFVKVQEFGLQKML